MPAPHSVRLLALVVALPAALAGYLDEDSNVREVCVGTGAKGDRQHYLDRPRIAGDYHGQAPVLFCTSALMR